ncbi:MAG: hypothetical protein KDN19_20375 [Verrucomicrobiae bacterium]|nr:hypothetical protein [Verrucomicrobiae bacterium]
MKAKMKNKPFVSLSIAGILLIGLCQSALSETDILTGKVRIRVANTASIELPNSDTATRRKRSTRAFSLIVTWVKGTGEYALYIIDTKNRSYVKQTGIDSFGIQSFPDLNKNKRVDIQRFFQTFQCDTFDFDDDTFDDTIQSKQGSMSGRETNVTKAFGHKTRDVARVSGSYTTNTAGTVVSSAKMSQLFSPEISQFPELKNPITSAPRPADGVFSSERKETVTLSYNRKLTETFSDVSFSNTQANVEDALDMTSPDLGPLFRPEMLPEPEPKLLFPDGFEHGDVVAWGTGD